MRKRVSLLFLIMLSLMGSVETLSAQEAFPVLVMSARSSVTVFTNWQLIELTYTIGYLDGYALLYDGPRGISPQSMSFGLELDPDLGVKLIRRHQRRYKNENYVDLVYYVRHIGEQKGDIVIPEQIFYYYKEEPGQPREGQEVYETKSLPIRLRYDSVLTKDANDIMDRIDFGSFERQEQLWKRLALGLILTMLFALFWLFRKPVLVHGPSRSMLQLTDRRSPERLVEEPLLSQEALRVFTQTVKESQHDPAEDRVVQARLANGLRELLAAFVPDILPSDTPEEIRKKILNPSSGIGLESPSLLWLANMLIALDGVLYGRFLPAARETNIRLLLELLEDLRQIGSRWYKPRLFFVKLFLKLRGRSTRW